MQCAKRDELSAKAAHVLGVIVKLGNEQIDCLKSNDQKRLLEIDKELERQYGEKQRAFGALSEHSKEHGC